MENNSKTGNIFSIGAYPYKPQRVITKSNAKRFGYCANTFYEDMKPLFFMYKLLGLLPYQVTSKGEINLKIISISMLYAMIMTAGILTSAILILRARIKIISTGYTTFQDNVVEIALLTAYVNLIVVSFAFFIESGKITRFINSWGNLQARYTRVTGKHLIVGMRKRVRIVMISIAPNVIIVGVGIHLRGLGLEPWQLIFTILAPVMSWCTAWTFLFTCFSITTTAKLIGDELVQYIANHGLGRTEKIMEYKFLWLNLSQLTQNMGHCMGFTFGSFILCCFISQVFAFYCFFSNLTGEHQLRNISFGMVSAFFGIVLFSLCTAAQNATQEVGMNFQRRLQAATQKYSPRSIITNKEVQSFFSTISINQPIINVGGFVAVNRALSAALMSQKVTYTIILMQLQQSTLDQDTKTNITNKAPN